MNEIIVYLLQSAAVMAVLYGVYWLFLRKDTFFLVNRFYLLASVLLSLFIPLVNIRIMPGGPVYPVAVMLDPVLITPDKVSIITARHLTWIEILSVIYLTGVAIFLLRFIVQITQLMLIVRKHKITRHEGTRLVFVDKVYSPFSFFNLLFIRKEFYIDGKLTPVVEHEKIHIRQWHTIDLLLIELATIIQWFNPFVWFLGRSVKTLHEYLADEGVLRKGFGTGDYQTLILNEAMGLQLNNLTNNFNISLIKNRIKMMTKKRSASWTLIKITMAIPAFLAVLFFFTAGQVNTLTAQDAQKSAQVQQQKTSQKAQQESVSQSNPSEEPVFQVVETIPQFPGGQDAMVQYMVKNIKYPDQAKKDGVQGTVVGQFIVEKDGSITNTKVLRGVGSGCDEEALRVVSGMPKWSPGKDKNEPVRVEFALPIKFSLDDKASKAKENSPVQQK